MSKDFETLIAERVKRHHLNNPELRELLAALRKGQFYYSHLGCKVENKVVTQQITKLEGVLAS